MLQIIRQSLYSGNTDPGGETKMENVYHRKQTVQEEIKGILLVMMQTKEFLYPMLMVP